MASNSFIFSTELVALILGAVVYLFTYANKPQKTKEFYIIFGAVSFLMLEMFTVLFFEFYFRLSDDINAILVNVVCVFMWFFHNMAISLLLVYIYTISDFKINFSTVMKVNGVCQAIYFAIGFVLIARDKIFILEDNHIVPTGMIAYEEWVSFLSTLMLMLTVLVIYKHFPRPLLKYIVTFLPILICIQILQIKYSNIKFTGVVYMIPMVVMFILYHNSPYDTKTGSRGVSALSGYMDNLIKKHDKYTLIYVKIRLRNLDENADLQKRFFSGYWRFCRDCEYFSRHLDIFQINSREVVIIITEPDEGKHENIIEKVRAEIEKAKIEFGYYIVTRVLEFKENDHVKDSQTGRAVIRYMSEHVPVTGENQWVQITDEEYKGFDLYNKIKDELLDIEEKGNLNDERVLCFAQPIYNVGIGGFKNAEALMRLQIDGEMISPVKFIPIAEELGLIHSLTKIILNKVCTFISENKGLAIEAVSVNCSMSEMAIETTHIEFLRIIRAHNLSPERIRIELTESEEIDSYTSRETVIVNLRELYKAGVRFYLDDFGTGYSNLGRIINFNMHTVKFDKSIFYKTMVDKSMEELVDTMIKVFKSKGVRILVEGVEDEDQQKYAEGHGYEYIQGFHFAKPEPIENITTYFAVNE